MLKVNVVKALKTVNFLYYLCKIIIHSQINSEINYMKWIVFKNLQWL